VFQENANSQIPLPYESQTSSSAGMGPSDIIALAVGIPSLIFAGWAVYLAWKQYKKNKRLW
jgi:hypothetical protein